MRCELLGFGNVEAVESNRDFLATLASDGDLFLLYQTAEAKNVKVKRDCTFLKLATTEAYVVVVGWKDETKEATFLLYDANLRFRDEITVKMGRVRSSSRDSKMCQGPRRGQLLARVLLGYQQALGSGRVQ